ncbi:MAG: hypothetical protein SGPRY_003872 [Prymnesium sp.]
MPSRAPALPSAGVLMCVYQASSGQSGVIREAPLAAAQLKRVMAPPYPILLLANTKARQVLRVHAAFDRTRDLRLDRRLQQMSEGSRPGAQAARPYLHKLSCLIQSDFNQTVFIDCDTFVLHPSLSGT